MTTGPAFGEGDQGRQHPPDYREDLNPASLNLEQTHGTAFDLQPLPFRLEGLPDEVLQRVPIVAPGARLKQGATYVDLGSADGEFAATGEMIAAEDSLLVPKAAVDYEAWNLLMERLAPPA